MDNVQNCDSYANISSPENCRPYGSNILLKNAVFFALGFETS
jgi:hypothetical protein